MIPQYMMAGVVQWIVKVRTCDLLVHSSPRWITQNCQLLLWSFSSSTSSLAMTSTPLAPSMPSSTTTPSLAHVPCMRRTKLNTLTITVTNSIRIVIFTPDSPSLHIYHFVSECLHLLETSRRMNIY